MTKCCCDLPPRVTAATWRCTAWCGWCVRDGWTANLADLPFVLPPGEYLETDVALTMPPGTPAGLYPVRAQLAVTGSGAASMPPAWRQVVEDVCMVVVGAPSGCSGGAASWSASRRKCDVAAGESARIAITVGTDARADLAVEAHLISPWGTWEWIGPAAYRRRAAGRWHRRARLRRGPARLGGSGEWWALIRVGCAGRLIYSPAVRVTVR